LLVYTELANLSLVDSHQRRSEDLKVGAHTAGMGDGSPTAGSRGGAPGGEGFGGVGETSRKLTEYYGYLAAKPIETMHNFVYKGHVPPRGPPWLRY